LPLALYAAVFIVVIAVFEMPLGIPDTARHGPYRQHRLTLTLFEFRFQAEIQACEIATSWRWWAWPPSWAGEQPWAQVLATWARKTPHLVGEPVPFHRYSES